jgi:hypothetical protein
LLAAAASAHGRFAMAILLKIDPAVAAERIANHIRCLVGWAGDRRR